MKSITYLFILFFTLNSYGATLPTLICKADIDQLLSDWKSENTWQTRNGENYFSPTSKFGEWIIVAKVKNTTTVVLANEKAETQVEFNHNCERTLKVVEREKKSTHHFGDTELKAQIKDGKGVIYIWSPHMPLSKKGLHEMQAAAKELKLNVLSFVEKKNILYSDALSPKGIDSFELSMRNAFIHFPAVLVFENGKIKSVIKHGYENKNDYKKDLTSMLNL